MAVTVAGRLGRSGAAAGACALALTAVLAGCGSSGGGSADTSATGGGTAGTSATGGGGTAAGTKVVEVRMTDFRLGLSTKTFTAGDYTFVATNDGHTVHSLEVEGRDGGRRLPHDLRPGESAKLTVTLKNGSYELYCPVGGHKDLGMQTEISVGGGT